MCYTKSGQIITWSSVGDCLLKDGQKLILMFLGDKSQSPLLQETIMQMSLWLKVGELEIVVS